MSEPIKKSDDFEIFEDFSMKDLFKQIVVNSNDKRNQLDTLISDLRPLIKGPNDAMIIVPMLKDYYDVGVKNDEQLVKLAQIIQKICSSKTSADDATNSSGTLISEDEREELYLLAQETSMKIKTSNMDSGSVSIEGNK